jgi:membrane-associated protein
MPLLPDSLHRASGASRACAVALFAGVLATYVLSALTPSLLAHHALLLEALSGNVPSILISGANARAGRTPLLLVLLAPLVGIVLYDVALWWAGRLWGNQVLRRFLRTPRARRRLARTEGWVARRGVPVLAVAYFLPLPNPATYLLCGASGMSLALFVLGDIVGTVLWTSVLTALGWAVGRPALQVVHTLNHYAVGITAVGVVVAIAVHRRRRRSSQTVAEV